MNLQQLSWQETNYLDAAQPGDNVRNLVVMVSNKLRELGHADFIDSTGEQHLEERIAMYLDQEWGDQDPTDIVANVLSDPKGFLDNLAEAMYYMGG